MASWLEPPLNQVAESPYLSDDGQGLIVQTYIAIIISFLSGIRWVAFLFFPKKCPRYFLLSSNVVTRLA